MPKKFALKISRGTTDRSTNLLLRINEDNIEGRGEGSPFSVSQAESHDTDQLEREIRHISLKLAKFHPLQRQEIAEILEKE